MITKIVSKILNSCYKILHYRKFHNVILYYRPSVVNMSNLYIGSKVRINQNVFLHADGGIVIKENVTLSYGVSIFSTEYNLENWNENKFSKSHITSQVLIKENVWLCANVTVLPGVTIEEGVVVAAGSVVTKSLTKAGTLYGGNPAKEIRRLY